MSALDLSSPLPDAGRHPASGLLRLRVRLHRGHLDRLLAEGRNPTTDPRLALRATQLARPALRAALAAALREAVRSIDESPRTRFQRPAVPVDASSVRTCTREMDDVARGLTAIDPGVRGVAIIRTLLTNGLGPLYIDGQADQLRNTLLTARSAL